MGDVPLAALGQPVPHVEFRKGTLDLTLDGKRSSEAFAFREAKRVANELLTGAGAGVAALLALVDFPFNRPAELFLFWTLMAIACLAASTAVGSIRGQGIEPSGQT